MRQHTPLIRNNFIRSGRIQKRILSATVSCLVGMCILVSSVCFYVFHNYLQTSLIQSTETSLRLLADAINNDMSDVYRLVHFGQTNALISEYVSQYSKPNTTLTVSTYDRIYEEYNINPSRNYIPRVAVMTNDYYLQVVNTNYSSTTNLSQTIPQLPFFEELLTSKGYNFSTGFIDDPLQPKRKQILPVIRPITYQFSSVQGGFLFLEVSSDLFTNAFKPYALAEDSFLYLTLGEHHYQYQDGKLVDHASTYYSQEDISERAKIENVRITRAKNSNGQSHIIVTVPLDMPGCYISQNISLSELYTQFMLFFGVFLGALMGIIAFGVLLMTMMNRMINIPISKMQQKMKRIAAGDFGRDSSIEWNHELGEIGKGINDLSENVYQLMTKRLEDEKQKKDLEYQMLQSQINPHFLYNTLNSIKWMATIQGAKGIAEMTTALAKLLKSISKGTSLRIPIGEELSLLQDYFTIQSYRYGGTITLNIQVDDEALYADTILKFTLQPLVENAIFHGIEPKGSGRIDIHVFYEHPENVSSDILITVRDNGVGMTPEKAHSILMTNNESTSDFFREIGTSNVHKRLQYEFGEAYGISIESEENQYTLMTIRMPSSRTTIQTTKPDGNQRSHDV